MYYLSRDQSLNREHYKSYSLDNAKDLFLCFIGELVGIRDVEDLIIVNPDSAPVIRTISPSPVILLDQSPSILPNIEIKEEISYCMGHGGVVESGLQCKICNGKLCNVCLDGFFICPGSLNDAKVHKFISK